MPTVPGPFEWTRPFFPLFGATWDFLLDGEGVINLSLGGAGYVLLCGPTTPEPAAVIEEAVFIIEGDFPVQVETKSWGSVKAIYR